MKLNKELIVRSLIFLLIPFLILLISVALFITKVDCNNSVVIDCRTIALRNTFFEIGIFSFAFLSFIIYLRTKNRGRIISSAVIILLVAFAGIYNAQKFLPLSKISTFKPQNNLIDKIKELNDYGRVAGLGDAKINSNFATLFRFYDNDYYDPLYIKRYGEFIAYANEQKDLKRSDVEVAPDLNTSDDLKQKRNRLFELTGTKYLIYRNNEENSLRDKNVVWKDDKWIISENNVLPRAYIVQNFLIEKGHAKILGKLFGESFDPKSQVVIEEKPNIKPNKDATYSLPEIVEYQNEKVIIKTETNDSGILVLTDNYYPSWKAYVNGEETKIFRANYTFRAVEVPSGKNIIEFLYEPESVRLGIIISVISLMIFSSFLYYYKRGQD